MLRLLPDIRYGTGRYPEHVARRLRALNITTWVAAAITGGFAVTQFLDPSPALKPVAMVDATIAPMLAAIPLLHRFGSLAAPLAFTVCLLAGTFIVCAMIGTGTGMQFYYLAITALAVLFFGTEHISFVAVLSIVAAVLIVVLEIMVPRETGVQPSATTFASFIATTAVSCAILFTIVVYAVRAAEREHDRSESLLENILPAAIASRLKSGAGAMIADKYPEASILFADMAGFTARASDTTPEELVRFLNRVFSDFDRLVERHGLEKIKTTGDSYMVVAGVPSPRSDHAVALAQLALDMRDVGANLHDPRGRSVPIRIGISSGPVVAGVVGTRKFFYDVWGDAVNVASRMESTGVPGNIQVSPDAYALLKEAFVLEERGPIDVKGKGTMSTWFLIGRGARQ